ncbi:MAG: AraC family transcriptional regulator [Opitutaceae bacterium]|jgi:AraC-like DNA-binding protein/quercetin dioxygenase-like cupin family protein|nr:AraC family transcriptional regulator [Opitutaceae bacterium]
MNSPVIDPVTGPETDPVITRTRERVFLNLAVFDLSASVLAGGGGGVGSSSSSGGGGGGDGSGAGDTARVELGRYACTRARAGLAQHTHPGALEICYLAKGTQLYRVGGRTYALRSGDVFVTFPGEPHDTGRSPEEKGVLYWLILTVPDGNPGLADALLALRRRRHFKGAPALQVLLDDIIRQATTAPRHPLASLTVATRLTAFLLEVIRCGAARAGRDGDRRMSTPMRELLSEIERRIEEPLTIRELAAGMGLSVPRFKARCRQELGIPPADYIQRRKIAVSKQLLADERATVTDVAYRLGFSSSQYFATVFRRHTGQPPGDWRKQQTAPRPANVPR